MPEEIEVETKDLQEAIEEMHEEREAREAEAKKESWTKYVGLSTAILAVFAAIGALQAGSCVNEALKLQLESSDTWNEYQADRQKEHSYGIALNTLLDNAAAAGTKPAGPMAKRIKAYQSQLSKEQAKEKPLSEEAKKLKEKSDREFEKHEPFAYSVAMIQVSIALSAVAALSKTKWVWYFSMLCGLGGIAFFAWAFTR